MVDDPAASAVHCRQDDSSMLCCLHTVTPRCFVTEITRVDLLAYAGKGVGWVLVIS